MKFFFAFSFLSLFFLLLPSLLFLPFYFLLYFGFGSAGFYTQKLFRLVVLHLPNDGMKECRKKSTKAIQRTLHRSQTTLRMLCAFSCRRLVCFFLSHTVPCRFFSFACAWCELRQGGFVDYMKYVRVCNLIERGHPKVRETNMETHKNNYKIFFKSLCVCV